MHDFKTFFSVKKGDQLELIIFYLKDIDSLKKQIELLFNWIIELLSEQWLIQDNCF